MFASSRFGVRSSARLPYLESAKPLYPRRCNSTVSAAPPRRRSGNDLSLRGPVHAARLSRTEKSFADPEQTSLSAPGLAHIGSKEAASRLARESEEYTLVDGVRVPRKPRAPESDECCMSGCAVCVYDLYLESKASYSEAIIRALDDLEQRNVDRSLWPKDVIAASNRRKGVETVDGSGSLHDEEPLDATMKAFLELENKLKSKS